MTYILSTIGDKTYIVTESQKNDILQAMNQGSKGFTIGQSLVMLHQITSIDPLDTYHRQMKTKLAIKDLRMCKKCGTIIPRSAECPCKEQPEKYPSILEVARQENPELDKSLKAIEAKMAIPSLKSA